MNDRFQLFFTNSSSEEFNEEKSISIPVTGTDSIQRIVFNIKSNIKYERFRLDVGSNPNQEKIALVKVEMRGANGGTTILGGSKFYNSFNTYNIVRDSVENGQMNLLGYPGPYDPSITFKEAFTNSYLDVDRRNNSLLYSTIKIATAALLIVAILFLAFKVYQTLRPIDFSFDIMTFIWALIFVVAFVRFRDFSFRWGHWDAWAIWTAHAKFLMSPSHWQNMFSNHISWTHADYPLLLSSFIALLWNTFSEIGPEVPITISLLILLLIFWVLFSTLKDKNLSILGVAAVLILSMDATFIEMAASQYADTLLSGFYLIAIALFVLKDQKHIRYFLFIGLFSALTTWVKNEGIIFLTIFSSVIIIRNRKNVTVLKQYFLGMALPLIAILLYKFLLAPVNDLVSGQSSNVISKILAIERYKIVGLYFLEVINNNFQFLILGFTLLLFSYAGSLGKQEKYVVVTFLIVSTILGVIYYPNNLTRIVFVGLIILVLIKELWHFGNIPLLACFLTLLVYLSIYIVTPHDLQWHLSSSLPRLIHQIYPSLLLIFLIKFGESFSFKESF